MYTTAAEKSLILCTDIDFPTMSGQGSRRADQRIKNPCYEVISGRVNSLFMFMFFLYTDDRVKKIDRLK